MIRFDLHPRWHGQRIASAAIVWNTVMPALGVALILGASILPALAVATVAAVGMHAVLAAATPRTHRRHWLVPHRHVPHER